MNIKLVSYEFGHVRQGGVIFQTTSTSDTTSQKIAR